MVLRACRLVRWDMRAREGAVQDSPVLTYQEGKDYASKTNFNCMATSGHLSATPLVLPMHPTIDMSWKDRLPSLSARYGWVRVACELLGGG